MATAQPADLFVLKPDFSDPAYPDEQYFDRYSALLEGVVLSFPRLADKIAVHRVDFARPRTVVARVAGADHQTLPRLVLPQGVTSEQATSAHRGRQSVVGASAIIAALVELYGISPPHP